MCFSAKPHKYEHPLIHHCASFLQGLERIRDFPNLAKLSNKERSNSGYGKVLWQ